MKKTLIGLVLLAGCASGPTWRPLDKWTSTQFGGEGEVRFENGTIVMEMGATLTGVTWTGGPLPTMNYEISLEAMKLDGNDFFCGLTFPVGDDPCSFIVGGWAGGVVGLSSLDELDASENQTSTLHNFDKNRWYHIRVRVTPDRIECRIDGEEVVDVVTTGKRISIRPEVGPSKPLGIAAWMTKAALRDIKIRDLRSEN